MFQHLWTIVLLLVCVFTFCNAQDDSVVTIGAGKLKGSIESFPMYKTRIFRGIPYALPPVGDLRWISPQSYNQTWSGVRDATKFAFDCPQLPTTVRRAISITTNYIYTTVLSLIESIPSSPNSSPPTPTKIASI
jgi:hypothetical protein